MTDREKLIEILQYGMDKYFLLKFEAEIFADHLIANGVTFAKDTDVPSKWISVDDRLPKNFSLVLAYEPDYGVSEAEFEHGKFRWASNENLAFATHWMPLPQPPREETND